MPQSKIAVIYPYIPHYRKPVFSAMASRHADYCYVFFGGENLIEGGIRSDLDGCDFEVRSAPILHRAGITLQRGLLGVALGREFDGLVFLGNPYFISTWFYALAARARGKKVLFWTHGWLERERGMKGWVRKTFYRLADSLLLYGNRARHIGRGEGFPSERLHVVYNSLDYAAQRLVRQQLESGRDPSGRSPYVACVARLTPKCRFDLAIDAIARLDAERNTSTRLVLIGDGPERTRLQELAAERGVNVEFLGELYDEGVIGAVLFHARAVVSPGKVGLTAMHSLAYGTPVITHGNFAEQMPEFEAVIPGITGDFFRQGDAADLAAVVGRWLDKPRTAEERRQCVEVIESRYTPERQVELIEAALAGSPAS